MIYLSLEKKSYFIRKYSFRNISNACISFADISLHEYILMQIYFLFNYFYYKYICFCIYLSSNISVFILRCITRHIKLVNCWWKARMEQSNDHSLDISIAFRYILEKSGCIQIQLDFGYMHKDISMDIHFLDISIKISIKMIICVSICTTNDIFIKI